MSMGFGVRFQWDPWREVTFFESGLLVFGRACSLDNPTVPSGCWCSGILAVLILYEIAQQDWHSKGYERLYSGRITWERDGQPWKKLRQIYFIVYVKQQLPWDSHSVGRV